MKNDMVNRIHSLDGLRAISIIFVIFSHAIDFEYINFGNLGVKIFFIISSFLIIKILIKESNENRFKMQNFYLKRIFRIFPAFYFYLAVVYLFLNKLSIYSFEQFWRAPLFLANYNPRYNWDYQEWFVGHSWSLAVEEQFYILIAILFLFINKKIINRNNLLKILLFVIVLIPLIRFSYLYFNFIPKFLSGSIHRSFETVADSLAVGGVLALYDFDEISNKWTNFFKNKNCIIFIIIIFLMFMNSSYVVDVCGLKPRFFYNLFGLTFINFGIGIIMINYIYYKKQTSFYRFLNHPIMITIGLWSYSIYLWQQIWLYNWEIPIYYKFVGVLVCSILSYYFIEKPFLKIRDNYLKRKEHNDI